MKRFKSKKVKKKNRLIKIVFIFFFFFSYAFVYKYLETKRLKEKILDENINYINFNITDYGIYKIKRIINNPVKLLNYNIRKVNTTTYNKQVKTTTNLKKVSTNDDEIKEPIIYLYNTHDTEKYIDYNVHDAAYYLNNKLNDNNIYSIMEDKSMKVFLDENNLKYYGSYKASRSYLTDAFNNNPSLKYFIDIHRDSAKIDKTLITKDNKKYARVLFIVGLDNPTNEKNLTNSKKLNEIINNKVPGISRGVITKQGKGVNGVYNQDFSENVFLIEIGGVDNTKEEVINTLNIVYESLIEYIRGMI